MNPSFLSFRPSRAVVFVVACALTLGLLATATPAFAEGARLLSVNAAATADVTNVELDSEVIDPEQVFIQKTADFPDRGNVRVEIQLSAEAAATKAAEGENFITLGTEEAQIIARDDGRGGDSTAGDGIFTTVAFVDDAQMQERADEDRLTLSAMSTNEEVVFDGRLIVGTRSVSAFDVDGFLAGRRVELSTAVVKVDEDTTTTEEPVDGTTALSSIRAASHVSGTNVFQDRVLMIRDLGVVTDPLRTYNPCDGTGNPGGVWTFNHLMTEMANEPASGIDPSLFVENWLTTWIQNPGPTINSFTVSTRNQMQVILDQWRQQSGGGKLDLDKSPLRLLAIDPRIDLRTTTGGGGGYGANVSGNFLDAGEARFIFGFVAPPEWGSSGGSSYPATNDLGFVGGVPIKGFKGCVALPFTVILEYRVPKCDCFDVRGWARQWIALRNHIPGTTAYNSRLERLTEQFARRNADPRRPNGSAIGQVRTNEVALPQDAPIQDVVWELREFQLTQKPFSLLEETTTADTPHDSFNGSNLLFQWIQTVGASAQPLSVPLFFQGQNFLGANPQVPEANIANITFHWNSPLADPVADNAARFQVSVSSCNGCHRGDTGTPFVHVDPAHALTGAVLPAPLSGFLTGIHWADPAFGFPIRSFDDLARREQDIKQVARLRCFRFHPVNVTHVKQSLANFGTLPDDLFGTAEVVPLEMRPALGVDDMLRNPVPQSH